MRSSFVERNTGETNISVALTLEGGDKKISTGCGFFDHMMNLFASHGGFGLELSCKGDTEVDYHHSVEDIGIALGVAFREALGDRRGIIRYSDITLPMDEALILAAVDISGRGEFYTELSIPTEKVGDFDCELCEEFFIAFARNAGVTLHIRQLAGKNSHHIIEGCFKAAGRVMKSAVSIDPANPDAIPSTKGTL